jgi:hypothetical protein
MNQKNIFLGFGAVFLILISVFTVNHFNKAKQKQAENPFLNVDPATLIEQKQVKSDVEPDAMYPKNFVIGRFQKKMMTLGDLPVTTQFDLYRIKHEAYMRSLVSLKENFLIMYNYVDAKMGYPKILPNVTELLTVEDPSEDLIEKEYEKVKDSYPIKDPNLAKQQLAMDIKIKWHTEAFFKKLRHLEEMSIFQIYLLPPKYPNLEQIIKTEDIANLGSDDAKYTLSIFTNYGCKRCRYLNLKVSEVVRNLSDQVKLEQFVLGPPKTKRDYLEEYMPNFMNCVLQNKKELYWNIHVDLIQNKTLLDKMAKPIKEAMPEVEALYSKHFKDDYSKWKECAFDDKQLKKMDSMVDIVINLLGVTVQPAYYLNHRYLEIILDGDITASIKEAVKNPNWN